MNNSKYKPILILFLRMAEFSVLALGAYTYRDLIDRWMLPLGLAAWQDWGIRIVMLVLFIAAALGLHLGLLSLLKKRGLLPPDFNG